MSDYIGSRKQVDEYIGSRLVVAGYQGSRKYFDAFDTVSGAPPLTFDSRVQQVLRNYAVYGSAGGAGSATSGSEPAGYKITVSLTSGEWLQDYDLFIGNSKLGEEEYLDYESRKMYKRTEQLFNNDTITRGINISTTGIYQSSTAGCSDYIKVIPGESYYFKNVRGTGAYYSCVEYDENKAPLRNRSLPGSTASGVITMNNNTYYIRVNITLNLLSRVYVCKGTEPLENVPPYYIPTDPPVPFPAITAYNGNNTINSTETLSSISVTGRINV